MKIYIDFDKVKSRMESLEVSLVNSEFTGSDALLIIKTKHDMLRELLTDKYYRVEY